MATVHDPISSTTTAHPHGLAHANVARLRRLLVTSPRRRSEECEFSSAGSLRCCRSEEKLTCCSMLFLSLPFCCMPLLEGQVRIEQRPTCVVPNACGRISSSAQMVNKESAGAGNSKRCLQAHGQRHHANQEGGHPGDGVTPKRDNIMNKRLNIVSIV